VTVASGIQRVISAGAPTQRIRDKGQQHLPGDETWLIGEQRASGEKKYYLASQRAETNLRTLAAIIKARWICEQAHQQIKKNSISITSRDGPGKACTDTRS
jgi:SRSO17 transposase